MVAILIIEWEGVLLTAKSVSKVLLLGLCLAPLSCLAANSGSVEYGSGNKSQFIHIGVQWSWENQWFKSNGTHVGGYWDVGLSRWRAKRYQGMDATQTLTDVGITPVFRFEKNSKKGWYGEAGIGMHYLSAIYDNNHRKFSTKFQFGDHIGVGYVFDNGWDIGLKIQHFSNGSFKTPNPGVNFVVLKAAHSF